MNKTLDELMAELAGVTGDKTKLNTGAKMPENLVTAGNLIFTLTTERDEAKNLLTAEQGRVTALTGDKTKLAAGAVLPTDLVAAANEIASLKAAATTVDAKVAAKLAALGIKDNATAGEVKTESKAKTLTERVLEAQGCKTLAESETKYQAKLAAQAGL